MRESSAAILALAGLISAAIGSVDPSLSAYAARVMLVANFIVLAKHLVNR